MELQQPAEQPTQDTPTPAELAPVLVISREAFNYVVIAITFLIVGIAIGTLLANRAAESNRELISEAVAAALDARGTGAVATADPLEDSNNRFTVSADDDPFIGPEDAKVTVVEFGDYNCQYCRRFATETMQPLVEQYGDRVRFVYRDFPILADSSVLASLAAECLHEQDKFWRFHDMVFASQLGIDQISLTAMAEEVGADMEEFSTCVSERRHFEEIRADYFAGQALGVRATPIFFVNGRPISGAQDISVFQKIIDEELAAAESDTAS
jgi:protein-disulfide isomerase